MGMSQPTSTRTRQRLVENVARWESWLTLKNVN